MNDPLLLALAQSQAQPNQPSALMSILPLLLMFVIFYFLLIRPQQKRQREHREMIARLKKGDRVVTGGGLIGTIAALTDQELVLEVSEHVKVTVLRGQVTPYQPATTAEEKKD